MTIPSAIASLLYDHDIVIVPGLGAFVRHDQSAHVNVITNEFRRPSSSLGFDPQQREENTLVSDYLMACDGLSDEDARTAIATFVSECFTSLKEEGSVSLPGVGTLTMDEQHSLVFKPLDDTNFNGDAFGLEDLNPQPVYGGVEPIKDVPNETLRSSQRQNPHKVPVKEPSRGVLDTEDEPRRRTWWIWLLLLLLVAAGVALWYFKFRTVPTKPWPLKPVPAMHPRESLLPHNPEPEMNDTLALTTSTAAIADTLENLPETSETTLETTPGSQVSGPLEVIKPDATSKAFIIGGCFAKEQNALNMAVGAREKGCAEAFVMKRGTMYYVCYGQYPSTADAKAALPETLANYNPKAWILTK